MFIQRHLTKFGFAAVLFTVVALISPNMLGQVKHTKAAITGFDRNRVGDWINANWNNMTGYAQCTTLVGQADHYGGLSDLGTNLLGNQDLVNWMKNHQASGDWQFSDTNSLQVGDWIFYTTIPGDQNYWNNNWSKINSNGSSNFDHVAIVSATNPVLTTSWNIWLYGYSQAVHNEPINWYRDSNKNPYASILGVHINDQPVSGKPNIPPNQNVIQNGGFDNGLAQWQTQGIPNASVQNGVLNLTAPSGGWGAIAQAIALSAPSAAPFEVTVQLGNSSNVAKQTGIYLYNSAAANWSQNAANNIGCGFTVPANSSLRTYSIRGVTGSAWSGITLIAAASSPDGIPALLVDNVTVQYQPTMITPQTIECNYPPTPNSNLVANSGFDNGLAGWQSYGAPITLVQNGVLNLTAPSGGWGAVGQEMLAALPSGAPVEITLQLGNSSNVSKQIGVYIYNQLTDWTKRPADLIGCGFTIPANSPLQTYSVRGMTGIAWSDIGLTIAASSPDGIPALLVDNVTIQYQPTMITPQTIECNYPPTPNSNLVTNGGFDNGLTGWQAQGTPTASVQNGILNLTAPSGGWGAVGQEMFAALPPGAPVEITLQLGNSGSVSKQIGVYIYNQLTDWTKRPADLIGCGFTIPANSPLQTYSVRGMTGIAWSDIGLIIAASSPDGIPALLVDNVTVQYRPNMASPNPNPACIYPAVATTTPTNAPVPPTSTNTSILPTSTPVPLRIDTIGIYRDGTFYMRNSNTTGYANITVAYNPATQPYPIVGDWTGGGIDTIGVYDQSNGQFMLRNSNTPGAPDETFGLGIANDQPLSGRWQASATHSGVGVFRPSNGLIYLKNELSTGFADYTMVLGTPGDVGVAGDWQGQGYDSPGVFRPNIVTFYLSDQVVNGSVFGDHAVTLGIPGDVPIVGDWIGQGHDGVGVFRVSNGLIYMKDALTTGYADRDMVYGIANDIPVAGHWINSAAVSIPTAINLIVPNTPNAATATPSVARPTIRVTGQPNYDG